MPQILEDATGIHSDQEGPAEGDDNVSVQRVRAQRKQTEALIQSLNPISP